MLRGFVDRMEILSIISVDILERGSFNMLGAVQREVQHAVGIRMAPPPIITPNARYRICSSLREMIQTSHSSLHISRLN
eukprot:4731303-Prymnesium_polylepis.1